LLVSHQNQAVDSTQHYLSELLHCLPGQQEEAEKEEDEDEDEE